jgi:D-glycero-alpha-D-manno-heptose 1-phosphate guanylyltransferase
MQAIILAGGLGTRLRSALPDLPKAMAPIKGRPFLEYLLVQLRDFGIQDVVLCVGYKADVIEDHFGNGARLGLNIEYSREQELLGTGGALKLAEAKISASDFLVLNGDCFSEFDGTALLGFHKAKGAVATMLAVQVQDRSRFGSLVIDQDQLIQSFQEKGEQVGPGYINAGVYALRKELLDVIPKGEVFSLERQLFSRLCGNGLYAFQCNGAFIDIGIPEDWRRAQELLSAKIQL